MFFLVKPLAAATPDLGTKSEAKAGKGLLNPITLLFQLLRYIGWGGGGQFQSALIILPVFWICIILPDSLQVTWIPIREANKS